MTHKILLVDDEKGILLMLKNYSETCDYTVYTASNGKEALEKFVTSQILSCLT